MPRPHQTCGAPKATAHTHVAYMSQRCARIVVNLRDAQRRISAYSSHMNKRDFIRTSATAGLGLLFGDKLWAEYSALPFERLAEDETFWATIRAKYRLKPDYINLESGYYSIQSQPVLEAFISKVREINYQGSFY